MAWSIQCCPDRPGPPGDPVRLEQFREGVVMRATNHFWYVVGINAPGRLHPYLHIGHCGLCTDAQGVILLTEGHWDNPGPQRNPRLPYRVLGDRDNKPGVMWLEERDGYIDWWA
jgi:hypothetical protein